MTPERYRQVVALFEAACALPAERRGPHLAQACGEDAALRAAVEAMLAQDERRSLLRTRAEGAAGALALQALAEQSPAELPERIGDYRVLGVLGAGAMGTVYRAEQRHPRREVALKSIHWWTLSPQAVERFRFEAQALAQLQHPGIPQVFEVLEDAEHLSFAMELVEGRSLHEHAAALGADVRRVLALVADIADAVHHAHLRGLVHRDLKPDNLRVTPEGQPKVLDFGISLPVDLSSGAAPVREVSGTLAYMSPEQLWPDGSLDIRTDVYALGVVAYELLCGERPFQLYGLSFEEARERVRTQRVPTLGERRPALRGDVSHIVARAMARERTQRYASAAELAEDLRRHLRHEPVRAHPGGAPYRLGRFVRRNRVAVAAGALLFLALAGGGATSFTLFRAAEAARAREAGMRAEAEQARDRAQREAVKSAASVEFLSQLLREADPNRPEGQALTMREALDRAATRLQEGSLTAQPEVEATVRLTLAQAYRGLGLEETAGAQELAAGRLVDEGRLPEGEEAAAVLRAVGSLHEDRGHFAPARAAEVRGLALERTLHAGAHPHLVRALHGLGVLGRESGDFPTGEASFREALRLARELAASGQGAAYDVASPLSQLAILLVNRGRYAEAEPMLREALALAEAHRGPEHPQTASALHNLAWLMKEDERGREARPLLQRALAIREKTLGARHPRIAVQLTLHGAIAMDLGELDEAERAMREATAMLVAAYGPRHPQVVLNRIGDARLLFLRGRYAQAQALAEATAALHRERYGPTHWVVAGAESLVAQALLARGEREQGLALLRRSHATLQTQAGPEARATRRAAAALQAAEASAELPLP